MEDLIITLKRGDHGFEAGVLALKSSDLDFEGDVLALKRGDSGLESSKPSIQTLPTSPVTSDQYFEQLALAKKTYEFVTAEARATGPDTKNWISSSSVSSSKSWIRHQKLQERD